MSLSLDELIEGLDTLLADLTAGESARADAIGAVADVHRRGASNLVHYTVLRQHDRRQLQHELLDIGATSLATTEAHVRAKVRAARNVVAALRGDAGPWSLDEARRALAEGDLILRSNSEAVFGPMRPGRPTRIMVTFPSEAADDPELVATIFGAGMDIARINCAHDDPAAWARMAENVRVAGVGTGRRALVSMDLPGPKLRTGPILDGPAVGRAQVSRTRSGQTLAGARIWLTKASGPIPSPFQPEPETRPILAVQVEESWLTARRPGDVVTVADERGFDRTFTVTRVESGGVLVEGPHGTYVGNGAVISSDGATTTAGGIRPIIRRLLLRAGDRFVLTSDLSPVEPPRPGEVARIGCTLPEAIAAMCPGDPVLFDDGAISAVVESVTTGEATLLVTATKPGGQRLGAEKGINLPDTTLPVSALTDQDDAHLRFVAEHADLVAVSFIRTAEDVAHVLGRLRCAGADDLGLVLKIETRQGFENLPAILLTAMQHPRVAVMIARGDLAVEIGFERLAEVPRQILALCEAAHVPAIWATQVLETLAKTGQPSRSEITDAAAGQRAECVMLNKGPHIVDAIRTLDDILARMGEVQTKSRTLMRHIHSWDVAVLRPTEPLV